MFAWLFKRDEPLGRRGERLAARALKRAGGKILARNYRCPGGEADLIALIGRTLVFAEVKSRSNASFVAPESAVNATKREHYRKVARYYLRRTGRDDLPVRFDIITVVIAAGAKPKITHIRDAFR